MQGSGPVAGPDPFRSLECSDRCSVPLADHVPFVRSGSPDRDTERSLT